MDNQLNGQQEVTGKEKAVNQQVTIEVYPGKLLGYDPRKRDDGKWDMIKVTFRGEGNGNASFGDDPEAMNVDEEVVYTGNESWVKEKCQNRNMKIHHNIVAVTESPLGN